MLASLSVTNRKQAEIREESTKDCLISRLREIIKTGWLEERKKCHPDPLIFWNYRDELTIADGLILKGKNIMIPDNLKVNNTLNKESEIAKYVWSLDQNNHLNLIKLKLLIFKTCCICYLCYT